MVAYNPDPPEVPISVAPLLLGEMVPEIWVAYDRTPVARLTYLVGGHVESTIDVFGCDAAPNLWRTTCQEPWLEINGRPINAPPELAARAVNLHLEVRSETQSGGIDVQPRPDSRCTVDGQTQGYALSTLTPMYDNGRIVGQEFKPVSGLAASCNHWVFTQPRSESGRLAARALIELLITVIADNQIRDASRN
jgi:hypothetical protein